MRLTIRRFEAAGLSWALPDELTDAALEARLFAKTGNGNRALSAGIRPPLAWPQRGAGPRFDRRLRECQAGLNRVAGLHRITQGSVTTKRDVVGTTNFSCAWR